MIDGQVGDNYPKKFCSKDLSFVFWGSQNKRLTIYLYGLFFSFFFLLSFCNKAVWVQCWSTFSALSHFNLSGPRHVSFHWVTSTCLALDMSAFTVVFFGIACARQDGSYNDNFIYWFAAEGVCLVFSISFSFSVFHGWRVFLLWIDLINMIVRLH